MASHFHKPVQSLISLRKETLTEKTINDGPFKYQIPWTKVERGNLTADTTNYTSSFNLPHERDIFSSGSSLSLAYPELQQLNTPSFVIGDIHSDLYNEIIDGRSLTVEVPYTSVSEEVEEVVATGSFDIRGIDFDLPPAPEVYVFVDSVFIGSATAVDQSPSSSEDWLAEAIVDSINSYTSSPNYTATSVGSTVTISALAGTGSGPNGFVVLPSDHDENGYVTFQDIENMSGGVDEVEAGIESLSGTTIISSTYHVLQKSEDNALLGSNMAFLFSDSINLPYTGTTDGGVGTREGITTWDPTDNYLDRPSAVSYQNLQDSDINSDQREWSGINRSVEVGEIYPTTTNQGLNYDIPVGYVALEKGIIVLTHPSIVDGFPWASGSTVDGLSGWEANTAGTTTGIYFNEFSNVSFHEIEIEYKTNVVCMALPQEFYFTNNPTWDFEGNLSEYQLGSNNFDSTYITEIGLYNKNEELIAIAKLDRPKEKGYNNIAMFSLNIEV